jgi:oligopeptide/dipeptide ABC transporter ATP-binding protein
LNDPRPPRPQRFAAAAGHLPPRAAGGEPLLSVRDLRSWFFTDQGVARAVDGVSFDVREGETLGIVGESGCGKTVTSLSILGLLPRPPARVMEGSSIRFRGEELVGAGEKRMRALRGNDISMIFQEPMSSLNPVYTIGSQITEALRLHRDLSRKAARAQAVRLLDEVGIPEPGRRIDEYPHQLSGGMRQRVMIAMALSCEPKLLIADEPTTALDVTIQAQILELLASLRESHGMAVLLITHDLGVVAEVCDRVVVMYAGQVVETGTVHEIFAEPAHPYTRALLGSLPDVERPGQRLVSIPGTVPSPTDWPEGCRFRARCPSARGECERSQELVRLASAARAARCWLAGERAGVGGGGVAGGGAEPRP